MQVGAELWVDGDFADLVAFAEDSQGAFAGGELDVVQVQAVGGLRLLSIHRAGGEECTWYQVQPGDGFLLWR